MISWQPNTWPELPGERRNSTELKIWYRLNDSVFHARGTGSIWFVYALRCRDGSIYTGVTTDLSRRIRTHNAGEGGAYTRTRRPVKCIFKEVHPSRSSALKREAEIKGWDHAKKKRSLTSRQKLVELTLSDGDGGGAEGWGVP